MPRIRHPRPGRPVVLLVLVVATSAAAGGFATDSASLEPKSSTASAVSAAPKTVVLADLAVAAVLAPPRVVPEVCDDEVPFPDDAAPRFGSGPRDVVPLPDPAERGVTRDLFLRFDQRVCVVPLETGT